MASDSSLAGVDRVVTEEVGVAGIGVVAWAWSRAGVMKARASGRQRSGLVVKGMGWGLGEGRGVAEGGDLGGGGRKSRIQNLESEIFGGAEEGFLNR